MVDNGFNSVRGDFSLVSDSTHNMSSITLYSVFVLVLLQSVWAAPYTNCDGTYRTKSVFSVFFLVEKSDFVGSVEGVIESIDISKCANNARRCILRRNTNATMTINFKTSKFFTFTLSRNGW